MNNKNIVVSVALVIVAFVLCAYSLLKALYFGLSIVEILGGVSGIACLVLAGLIFLDDAPDPIKYKKKEKEAKTAVTEQKHHTKKISGYALTAAVLSTFCTAFAAMFIIGNELKVDTGLAIVDGLIAMIYWQFIFSLFSACSFWVGALRKSRGCVLAGAICSCLAAVSNMMWLILYVAPIVFGFIAYAKMGRSKKVIYYVEEE